MNNHMNRRKFMKTTGLSAVTALAGTSLLLKACHTEEDMIGQPNWVVDGGFDRAVPIPATLPNNGKLIVQGNTAELLKGKTTQVFGYGNGVLGPTIKASMGETVNVELQNNLSEPTNVHWHGLILPADMDGHPVDLATAGSSKNFVLPVQQRAGTYWYHPHPHGLTARQVFNGLAGLFIVTDNEENALNLPSGAFELPLVIQDKRFSGSTLDYSPTMDEIMTGYLGEQILVNGIHSPFHNVGPAWYRLRLLNGSTARVYNLAFSNGIRFQIIGSDGGLLQSPEEVSSLLLGPGERADILVNFSGFSGKDVLLTSQKFDNSTQGKQTFTILKFRVTLPDTHSFQLPSSLSVIMPLMEASASRTRLFDIAGMGDSMGGMQMEGMHTINGKVFDMNRVDETVQAGAIEVWEFDNMMGDEIHPMHIHGVQFQVMERMGGRNSIIASEKGWKDTVLLLPGEKVRLIMKFPEYKGKFVLHCHNLEHEDDGMMLNYEIV